MTRWLQFLIAVQTHSSILPVSECWWCCLVVVEVVVQDLVLPFPLTVPNYYQYSANGTHEPVDWSQCYWCPANNMIPSLSSTVSTSYSSSDISPTPLFCPTEGIWNQTLACNSTRIPTSLRARCLNNRLANGFGKWSCFFAVTILYVLQQFVFVIAMEHGDLNPAKHLLD